MFWWPTLLHETQSFQIQKQNSVAPRCNLMPSPRSGPGVSRGSLLTSERLGVGCSAVVSLRVFLALEKWTANEMALTLDGTAVTTIVGHYCMRVKPLHKGGQGGNIELRPSPVNDPDPDLLSTRTTCNVRHKQQRAVWLPRDDASQRRCQGMFFFVEPTGFPWVVNTVLRHEPVSESPRRAVRSVGPAHRSSNSGPRVQKHYLRLPVSSHLRT